MWVRSLIAVWLSVLSLGAPADECLPSEWGAADQIGAANRITPERTIAAAALVRKAVLMFMGLSPRTSGPGARIDQTRRVTDCFTRL